MTEVEHRKLIDFAAVRSAVPLLGFVRSLGISLHQEGRNWRGKCPLHREKHGASFLVYPDNRWLCHGKCAALFPCGGDVVDLAGALWSCSDRLAIVERLMGEAPKIRSQTAGEPKQSQPQSGPKWPARSLEQIDAFVRAGPGLYNLWESSPVRFGDSESHAEEIIDVLFPGNPLLCVAKTEYQFATRWRETWRGRLSGLPLIVANPMVTVKGKAQHGGVSEHSLDATAARVYLVIEFDFARLDNNGQPTVFGPLIDSWQRDGIQITDACAALLWHLAAELPLVLAVHSGNKSLHGWYRAFDRNEQKDLWPFMRYAYSLGADHVTWSRSQFVRLPDGRRENGAQQVTYYLNAANAVTL
jgi:hypothetical protein